MAQGAQTGPLASSGKNISQELTGGSVGDPFSNGNPLFANCSPEEARNFLSANLAAITEIGSTLNEHVSGAVQNVGSAVTNFVADGKGGFRPIMSMG